jgi:glycerol-3-phosphate O-acyltransferase/dihydroxyacetone phosphate acyltransferase
MLYRALRAAADVALRWYYADIVIQGAERVPAHGPLVIASNHPNALVDALLVSTALRRRIRLTAKATLFEHPLLAPVLRAVGVVPLRRAKDELAARRAGTPSVARNADSFRQVTEALVQGGAVLVFPEGISHDEPTLAPLKTGAARMALAASEAGAHGLHLLPLGLIFERKEAPRSRVLVRVGEPIDVGAWRARNASSTDEPGDAGRLTADLDAALRHVTLNFASEARAQRAVALASALAALVDAPPALAQPRSLATEAELARRIETATDALEAASPEVVRLADRFIARVEALNERLRAHGAALGDVRISPRLRHGAWFVVREGLVFAAALPVALFGRVMHWLPLRLARTLAMRPLVRDPSRDQPAMRTIVLGLAFVLAWYALQAALVARWLGGLAAVLWLVALVLAGHIDFILRDRRERAWRRARTYLALRADPALRRDALAEIDGLIADGVALETALLASPAIDR